MDEKRFEQDYRDWKRQTAPDLWDRIEGRLKDYPKREASKEITPEGIQAGQKDNSRTVNDRQPADKRALYRWAAGIAAVLCVAALAPGLYQKRGILNGSGSALQETTYAAMVEETASVTEFPGEAEGVMQTKSRLTLPEDALTVPQDSAYFSQAILSDSELVCTATIEDVSLEYDAQGRANRVVYQLVLDQVHAAQDYLTATSQITVKSPIIRAEGDEAWILYQMQAGKTYLLPLKKQEESWELLYPFAPQIQLTDTQGYLFHSGYTSLINETTQVVAGEPEGKNDYFYDRMLVREDEYFLSDFLTLIQ